MASQVNKLGEKTVFSFVHNPDTSHWLKICIGKAYKSLHRLRGALYRIRGTLNMIRGSRAGSKRQQTDWEEHSREAAQTCWGLVFACDKFGSLPDQRGLLDNEKKEINFFFAIKTLFNEISSYLQPDLVLIYVISGFVARFT